MDITVWKVAAILCAHTLCAPTDDNVYKDKAQCERNVPHAICTSVTMYIPNKPDPDQALWDAIANSHTN
jgi:hypothetical protein